jgi:hypothetical protein
VLDSEELAELHAIIQAIECERRSGGYQSLNGMAGGSGTASPVPVAKLIKRAIMASKLPGNLANVGLVKIMLQV